MAKEGLCEYLQSIGEISVTRRCTKCKKKSEINSPTNSNSKDWNCEISHEYNFLKCRFDIACLDNNKIIFGIEILNTHITGNVGAREGIEWVELTASDVIGKLSQKNVPIKLNFEDQKSVKCPSCCQFARTGFAK